MLSPECGSSERICAHALSAVGEVFLAILAAWREIVFDWT